MHLDRIVGAVSGAFTAVSVILALAAPSETFRFWAIVSAAIFGLICVAVLLWEFSHPLRRRWAARTGNQAIGIRRHLEAKPKQVGDREWGYGRAIDGRLMAAFVSVSVSVRGLAIDEGLIALTCELYRKGHRILDLQLSDHSWLGEAKGPQIAQDVIFQRFFAPSDQGGAPLAIVGDELEPRIIAQFSIDRSITSAALPTIRVAGPYQPGVRP
jgi:hypothetical protein